MYQKVRKAAHAEEQLDTTIQQKMCLDLKTLVGFYRVKENVKEDAVTWNNRFGKLYDLPTHDIPEPNFSAFEDAFAEHKEFFEEEYLKSWEYRRSQNQETDKPKLDGK